MTLPRAADHHRIMSVIEQEKYGERIPDRTDLEEIRPDARGIQDDITPSRERLPRLRKSTVNRPMGN